jgi:hypothetical protein
VVIVRDTEPRDSRWSKLALGGSFNPTPIGDRSDLAGGTFHLRLMCQDLDGVSLPRSRVG